MKITLIVIIGILILVLFGVNKARRMYKRMYQHQKRIVEILRIRLGDILTPKDKS